ncbi:MAG TPA: GMC family oxidoreductase [Chloroflexota bacterium]|nr:GMC family oxidoreductase [Chloroflexota bacterium]
MTPYTRQEVFLRRLMVSVASIAAVLSLATLYGAYVGPSTTFFTTPPWVSNTVAGLGLIALLAWFAAGDVRRFRSMARVLVGGLALATLASIVLSASPRAAPFVFLLYASGAVAGVMTLTLAAVLRSTKEVPGVYPWMTDKPITVAERIGQIVFGVFGGLSLIAAVLSVVFSFDGSIASLLYQPVFVAGSVVKMALLGAFALLAALQIRQNVDMVVLLILGHLVSLVAIVVTLLGIDRFGTTTFVIAGTTLSSNQMMQGGLLMDGAIAIAFSVLLVAMSQARLDYLGFMDPLEFRTVEALADCLVEGVAENVPSHRVALRLDRYLSSFPSTRLTVTRFAILGLELAPLLSLQPPLSYLSPVQRREFINRQYKQDIAARRGRHPILDVLQAAMRVAMQGVYIGYYSEPTVQRSIGYAPFSQRYADYKNVKPIRKYPALTVTTPADLRRQGIDVIPNADVVIIGSGAGGAILAEQLLGQGRDVLLLEKGLYVNPDEFTEDEVDMIGRLYSDGALQTSQSYRFQIIQGNCVGGSTVVNNAVCFDTPERVLQAWNDPHGSNAGIDVATFRQAQQTVKERLAIQSIRTSTTTRPWQDVLNPGDRVVEAGVRALGLKPGDDFDVVRANIADCLGCGYCNIGCKYGRKLSMLDEVLPKAQSEHGADRLRIFSEAQAVELGGGGRNIREIVVQLRDGRRLLIRNPKTVVVSAGTIASSWLLMRSGIGDGELPVGRHLCFNMGSPLHGYWAPTNGSHLNSFAGLQIAHYLELSDLPGFVCETWFNPPVAQAMAMPGWLDTHDRNMRRYRDLSAVGVLVGSETNAYVTPALLLRGTPDVVYRPTRRDLDTLVGALIYLGSAMFAGGAEQVMASAMSYRKEAIFSKPDELQVLHRLVKSDRDIILGTGHPQGGNAISGTRGKDRGVIDPGFKVYGYDNLYVCDASVFPSPTTVNPQLTVMTMAHYAAGLIR